MRVHVSSRALLANFDRPMTGGLLLAAALLACGLFTLAGCTERREPAVSDRSAAGTSTAISSGGAALRPVELPDLGPAAASVQEQVRERYGAFAARIADPGLSAAGRAAEYGGMGQLFMAAELLGAAEPAFLNAIALAPEDRRWPYYLGHLHRTRGAHAESAEYFEQARRLGRDDFATLIWLGEAYLAQDQPEKAAPVFERALSLQPKAVAALAGAGRVALARGDHARAVEYLEAALALDAEPAIVHYSLGLAYRGLGQLEKAEEQLRQRRTGDVLVPDPLMQELQVMLRSASAFETLGIRALDNGEPQAAAGYFREGLALAPDDPSLHHRLGTALFLTGDHAAAREQFETALKLSPGFARAHYSLGVMMASSGQLSAAAERFAAAVRHDPAYIEPRLLLADILRHSGRPQESLPHYARIFELDPRMADARFGHAMALVALQRYAAARDRLDAAMTTNPEAPELAHALARLLAAAPDARVRDGGRALALVEGLPGGQGSLELRETMAMALAANGQYDEAAARQREVIAAARQAGRDELIPWLNANLALYQQGRPARGPWGEGQLP